MTTRSNLYLLSSRTPNAGLNKQATATVNVRGGAVRAMTAGANEQTSAPFMRLQPRRRIDGQFTQDTIYDFYFPFEPINVTYENLADEIAELPRPGSTPLVVFKQHRLMRVSFEFLVAVPFDGIAIDVEDSLEILRNFGSNAGRDVQLFNMDTFLSAAFPYANRPRGALSAMLFKVADLTVTSTRRNTNKKITAATVSITLIESSQNPSITLVRIPKIKKRKIKKKTGKTGKKDKNKTVGQISDVAEEVAGQ